MTSGLIPIILNWVLNLNDVSILKLPSTFLTNHLSQLLNYGYLSQWLPVIGITFPNIVIISDLGIGSSMQHEWVSTLTELGREVDIAVDILDNLLLYDRLSGNMLTLNTNKLNAKKFIKESLRPFYRQNLSMSVSVCQLLSSVSHQIMTLHGGNLFVHLKGIGCGSTFTMEIPLGSERNNNNPCVDIDDVECTSFRIKSVSPMSRDKIVSPMPF
eukprot:gene12982-27400_t